MKRILIIVLLSQMISGCASINESNINDDLINAAVAGSVIWVQDALTHGADINHKEKYLGKTALHEASSNGHIDVAKLLLDKGADVNAVSEEGKTALMFASSNGYNEIIKLLLGMGADVNLKDSSGNTALINAMFLGDSGIIRMLLEHDVDKDSKDEALRIASIKGYVDIVKLLLENGANVDKKEPYGITGLMSASWNGHTKIVRLFLEKGADVNASDIDGVTSLMVASWSGYSDVVNLLIENGVQYKEKEADAIELSCIAYDIMFDFLKNQKAKLRIVPTVPVMFNERGQLEDVPEDQFQKMIKRHKRLYHLADVCQSPENADTWYGKSDQKDVWILKIIIKKVSHCWRCYTYNCSLMGRSHTYLETRGIIL